MSRDGYNIFIPEWRMRLFLLGFMAVVAYCAFIELQKSRRAVEGMDYAMRVQFDKVASPEADTVVGHHAVDEWDGEVDDDVAAKADAESEEE